MGYLSMLWQLPQIIIGFIFYYYCKLTKRIVAQENDKEFVVFWIKAKRFGGVSFGEFIFINEILREDPYTEKHEFGHSVQSKRYGVFYLIIVGIPSFLRAAYTYFSKKDRIELEKWYFSGWPEHHADILGNVHRKYS